MGKKIHQGLFGSKMTFLLEELPAWRAAGCGEDRVETMPAWLPLLKIVSFGIGCWLLSATGYGTKWTFDLIQYNSSA